MLTTTREVLDRTIQQAVDLAKAANSAFRTHDDVAVALPGGPQEDLIRIARDNPATVANVVRNWVNA